MPDTATDEPGRASPLRHLPRLGERGQIVAAATMWLIGASILLVRGIAYIHDRSWHAWALAAGLALGVFKSRMVLERVASRAVSRIRAQGPAPFLSFFSLKAWGLVALMMGGGIALRQIFVHPGQVGAGILGAIYIGVGTALFLADRVFWHAAFRRERTGGEAPPGASGKAE